MMERVKSSESRARRTQRMRSGYRVINFVWQLTSLPRSGHAREKGRGAGEGGCWATNSQPSRNEEKLWWRAVFLNGNQNEAGYPTIVVVAKGTWQRAAQKERNLSGVRVCRTGRTVSHGTINLRDNGRFYEKVSRET